MSRIPTAADIDAMSEEELEAYLASAQTPVFVEQPQDASTHPLLRATGANRAYSWLLIIGGLMGIAASWDLMVSEITLMKHPLANLTCDINPLVSCGASLDTPQGNLLGVPNSFIGGMAFAALTCVGVLLASGVKLPRWFWWGMCAALGGALIFIGWFLATSITVFGKLCPLCMLIWAVTIPVAVRTWVQAIVAGHLGASERVARTAWAVRWWVAGALYLAIVVVVLVAFWDGWVALLR